MDPAIAATLIGIMVSALLGVFAGAFHLLRSEIRDLRSETRGDLQEFRTETRGDHRETNARIDRLEGKLDMLILALARAGFLVDPQAPRPPADQQG